MRKSKHNVTTLPSMLNYGKHIKTNVIVTRVKHGKDDDLILLCKNLTKTIKNYDFSIGALLQGGYYLKLI